MQFANKTKSPTCKVRRRKTQHDNEQAMVSEITKTAAGVHLDVHGNRVIGGSQRSDGSVRRTVRVRPGFTPTEDLKKVNVRELKEKREQRTIAVTVRDGDPVRRTQSSFAGLSDLIRSNAAQNKVNEKTKSTGDPQPVKQIDAGKRSNLETAEKNLSCALRNLSVIDDLPPSKEPQAKAKKYVSPRRRKHPLNDSGRFS